MDEEDALAPIIKALLLAAGEGLSIERMRHCFADGERPTAAQVRAALERIAAEPDPVLNLAQVAGGWRLQIEGRYARWIDGLWEERPPRYSRALLETLALIIYRQPITRTEIEEIRGVSLSQSIIKTLTERSWVRVVGHREIPGRPALFGSTRTFLEDFNLDSLDQLPPLPDVKDELSLEQAVAALRPAPEEAPARPSGEDQDEHS